MDVPGNLCSHDEWSRLREVIVGTAGDLKMYQVDSTFAAFYFENIYEPITDATISPKYPRSTLDFSARVIEELTEDIEGLVKAIEDFGARVLRPAITPSNVVIQTPFWTSNATAPLNVRDQTVILGNTIIETASQVRGRLFENDSLKPIFQDYFDRGAGWLSMPRPTLGHESFDLSYLIDSGYAPLSRLPEDTATSVIGLGHEIMLDGAQCIRLGHDVLVNVANANHERGFKWLQRTLGHEFRFSKIFRLADSHIDSFVLPLRPGLLLLRSPSVIDHLPNSMQSWDAIIAPSATESRFPTYPGPLQGLASKYIDMNVLSLDENTVVVNSLYPELIAELEARRFVVVPVRHRHRRLFGGGFHCFTLDCVRDSKPDTYL